mgnify:CR=1 FL=1|jgi:hypothetical protein
MAIFNSTIKSESINKGRSVSDYWNCCQQSIEQLISEWHKAKVVSV